METGQSDQVGAHRETDFQTLNLPRPRQKATPKSAEAWKFAGLLVGAAAFGACKGLAQRFWGATLAQILGSSGEQAKDSINFLGNCLGGLAALAFYKIAAWREPQKPIQLRLERGTARFELQQGEYRIWSADTPFERSKRGAWLALVGLWLVGVPFSSIFWLDKVMWVVIGVFSGIYYLPQTQYIFKPLLFFDAQKIRIGWREFDWAKVERADIERLLDEKGVYTGTLWSFWDMEMRRLGRVTLPAIRCPQSQEVEMVAFAARKLGNRLALAEPATE